MGERLVLVDGAGGFLGRHVVDAVRRKGYRVRATDLPGMGLRELVGVENVESPLEEADLARLFLGVTDVVHVAGLFDLSAPLAKLRSANVELAGRIARHARLHGVRRFVHVSSVTVYGRPARVPADESTPFAPASPYEQTKLEGEQAVKAEFVAGLPGCIVRPSGIYGPHGRYGMTLVLTSYAIARAKGGRGFRSFRGGPSMNLVHVDDVADACVHLLDAPGVEGRAFNVADEVPRTWGELLQTIEELFGLPERRPLRLSKLAARLFAMGFRAMPESRRGAMQKRLEKDFERLVADRGLAPALRPRIDRHAYDYWLGDHVYDTSALRSTGFRVSHPDARDGLRSTFDWYVEQKWLPHFEPVTRR